MSELTQCNYCSLVAGLGSATSRTGQRGRSETRNIFRDWLVKKPCHVRSYEGKRMFFCDMRGKRWSFLLS